MNGKNKSKNGKSNGNSKGRMVKVRNISDLAMPYKNMPVMQAGSNYRQLNDRVVTLAGSDFITPVTVLPLFSNVGDRVLYKIPVSPSAFEGTRITSLSNLWERYRFKRFRIRYVPAVPMTLACQLVLYQDTDPTDSPYLFTSSDSLVRQAVAQTGAQQWNFNVPKTFDLAKRSDDQLYYTGIDKQNLRFSQQGTAYIIQITSPVNINGEPITTKIDAGSLFVDWEVEMQIPQINPSAVLLSSLSQPETQSIIVQGTDELVEWKNLIVGERYMLAVEAQAAAPLTFQREVIAQTNPEEIKNLETEDGSWKIDFSSALGDNLVLIPNDTFTAIFEALKTEAGIIITSLVGTSAIILKYHFRRILNNAVTGGPPSNN